VFLSAHALAVSLATFEIVYNIDYDIIFRVEIASQRLILREMIIAGKPASARKIRKLPTPDVERDPPAREPAAAVIIARSIEEDIVLGRRQPKERLVEQDLCEQFNTHRGDVRLALFELEKNGLVERIPNRGALVRGLTPSQVVEIYAVREELEVMAVRAIRFPVAPKDIEKLVKLQRQHSAAVADGDLLTVFYSNLSFHQILFGLCGNACLIETIDLLAQKVYGIRSYANAFPESLARARRDHQDMIKALRASRRDDLVDLTRRHLKPSPEAYIRAYERRFGKDASTA
jgi:DNA-binding GntR family transcriptional regulator